ncbi:MAG: hypothetical protein ACK4RG_06355 [Fimbriimonadales bacterium]
MDLLTGSPFGVRAAEFSSDGARIAVETGDSSVAVFATPLIASDNAVASL